MLRDIQEKLKNWYSDTDYRVLFSISLIMLLVFSGFLVINRQQTGEWFKRGLNLRGGKQLSIYTSGEIDTKDLEDYLNDRGVESVVRSAVSATGTEVMVQLPTDVDEDEVLGLIEEKGIDIESHSFNEVGPELGESFWKQSRLAMMVAFIFMGIVVFVVYKDFVPSVAIIFASFTDIIGTLAVMQVLDIPLTLASFAGLLLVIGYSIDSDIVLTTRVLKRRKGTVNERTFSAMKTALTMTITTLAALVVLYLVTTAPALREVATVLIIALMIDLVATWFGNASILRWWVER
ncbi:MAG: protein translocase subunit SecF [Candidatus Aenigmatarchaeota archaeon]